MISKAYAPDDNWQSLLTRALLTKSDAQMHKENINDLTEAREHVIGL